jgi:hypothetical protein
LDRRRLVLAPARLPAHAQARRESQHFRDRGQRARKALAPFSAELSSFRLYLDHGTENRLALPWAVGSFNGERDNKTFVRFYVFLEAPAANVLLHLLPQAGASSD